MNSPWDKAVEKFRNKRKEAFKTLFLAGFHMQQAMREYQWILNSADEHEHDNPKLLKELIDEKEAMVKSINSMTRASDKLYKNMTARFK